VIRAIASYFKVMMLLAPFRETGEEIYFPSTLGPGVVDAG
jgi:hypothetical protein